MKCRQEFVNEDRGEKFIKIDCFNDIMSESDDNAILKYIHNVVNRSEVRKCVYIYMCVMVTHMNIKYFHKRAFDCFELAWCRR